MRVARPGGVGRRCSHRAARQAGGRAPEGLATRVHIDAGLLAIVEDKAKAESLPTSRPLSPETWTPGFRSLSMIFICDTMHHLPKQAEYWKQLVASCVPAACRRDGFCAGQVAQWARDVHHHARAGRRMDDRRRIHLRGQRRLPATNFFLVYRR